jgi:DNA-binding transcriptional ArsR family regulator
MVESPAALDEVFSALGHPMRRALVSRLAHGEVTVSGLARPYDVSLNAVSKHLKVLEGAGLVARRWVGREAWVRLEPGALASARDWLDHYRDFWNARFDAIEAHLDANPEPPPPPPPIDPKGAPPK